MSEQPKAKTKNSRYVYFQIKPFKDNDRGIQHREKVIENLISLKDKVISFAVSGNAHGIKFYVKLPSSFKNYFENTFYSNYPTSDLAETSSPKFSKDKHRIIPKKGESFKERESFQKGTTYLDPMNDVLALFQNIDRKSRLDLFFDYTFKTGSAFKQAMELLGKFVKWARASSDKKTANTDDDTKKEPKKKQIYFALSYAITTDDTYIREGIEKNLISVFAPFITNGKSKLKRTLKRNHCSFSEVINPFHIPIQENFVKGLDYTLYRKLPFPTNIPNKETFPDLSKLTILGDTDYRGDKVRFGIKEEDKFRHIYIVGKTGTGKSTFISNMIISDMQAGNGLCVLDPHGELVDTIVESIPSHRINDVILFDISDTEYPIGFNLLQADNEDEKNRIASGVVSTFQKLFDNSRGPRLEYILRNVVLSIIDYPNATLMHILRVLTDKEFREEVISHVKDSVLLKFRHNEFNKWQDKQREEAV
jgi:guanylate kinase